MDAAYVLRSLYIIKKRYRGPKEVGDQGEGLDELGKNTQGLEKVRDEGGNLRDTAQSCSASRTLRRRRGAWELGENPQSPQGVGDRDKDLEECDEDLEGLEDELPAELAEEHGEEL